MSASIWPRSASESTRYLRSESSSSALEGSDATRACTAAARVDSAWTAASTDSDTCVSRPFTSACVASTMAILAGPHDTVMRPAATKSGMAETEAAAAMCERTSFSYSSSVFSAALNSSK